MIWKLYLSRQLKRHFSFCSNKMNRQSVPKRTGMFHLFHYLRAVAAAYEQKGQWISNCGRLQPLSYEFWLGFVRVLNFLAHSRKIRNSSCSMTLTILVCVCVFQIMLQTLNRRFTERHKFYWLFYAAKFSNCCQFRRNFIRKATPSSTCLQALTISSNHKRKKGRTTR